MSFDPCNRSLNIQKSIGTPTPKVGVHLGVWRFIPSHFFTLPGAWNVIPELHSWPTPLQALAATKAKVVTHNHSSNWIIKSEILVPGY